MLSDDERKEAIEACRQWAHIRTHCLSLATMHVGIDGGEQQDLADVSAFDKQMFRLGEKVWTTPGA